MKLEHVALTITDPEEITDFYQDILGMQKVKAFKLTKALAFTIFGFNKEVSINLLEQEKVFFEIFIVAEQESTAFNHICISIKNREEIINKALQKAYKVVRIKREIFDLIFIKDKSGNIFELKEKQNA